VSKEKAIRKDMLSLSKALKMLFSLKDWNIILKGVRLKV
jgi:hypothetical protein